MFNIKGFASINSLADNASGVISPLGELSANAQTYAKEARKGHYIDTAKGEVTFVSFDCRDENNVLQVVPTEYQTAILDVTNWLHISGVSGQVPNDPAVLVQNIYNEFGASVEEVQVGSIITSGVIRLPSWVAWSVGTEADGNRVKIWFSNAAFLNEYDQYEITVIPPTLEVDALMGTSPDVELAVNARTTTELMDLVATERGASPYTYLRTFSYDRVSITPPSPIPTDWTVLIWGIAGNNEDTIKDAIIEYILDNSEYGVEDWKLILPSLFTRTEFIITPMWDKIAIPNQTEAAGIYSPQLSAADITAYAELAAPAEYPNPHVLSSARAALTTYQSVVIVSFGGTENIDGIVVLPEKFPDYIAVSPSSADFNRMSPSTQAWVYLLHTLLEAAEEMTPFTDVPPGVSRTWRGDALYAAASIAGTQYLVTTKWYVNQP